MLVMDSSEQSGLALAEITLSRVTLEKIACGWAILLWCAGMVLPNLDSHTRADPTVKAIIAIVYTFFLIGPRLLWRPISIEPGGGSRQFQTGLHTSFG
jgi:hypothetical protein